MLSIRIPGNDLLFLFRGIIILKFDSMIIRKILVVQLGVQLDHENVHATNSREGGAAYCHGPCESTGRVGAARCIHGNISSKVDNAASEARGPDRVAAGVQLDHENVIETNSREGGAAHCHGPCEKTGRVGATRCIHGNTDSPVRTAASEALSIRYNLRSSRRSH